jgi:dihydrolipoamide dehydrogenase
VEFRGALGGTCLNVGCIPSKALLNISHKYHEAHHKFKDLGIHAEKISFDINKVMDKKTRVVNSLTSGIEMLFKKNKVTYLKGYGKFKDPKTLVVEGPDGKYQEVTAKNFIIATGSEPNNLPGGVLPIDEKRVVSSTGALSFKEVPKKLIVVGGGVIGLELGSVYLRLGSQVDVVEFGAGILPSFDHEVSDYFLKLLKKQGMHFHLNHKVVGGSVQGNTVKLTAEDVKAGKKVEIEGDYVLIATGRKPFTKGLNLQALNIETDKFGRIPVNKHWETKVKGVYAVGDVIEGPMLAHKGEEEGVATVETICGEPGHVNYNAIPNVVYTDPEVASVGLTEEELKAKGIAFNKGKFPFLANSRAKCNEDTNGFVKVLSDKTTDKILGMHIIGPTAGEMIAECVLAVEYGASSEDIARTCHAHPTLSEAIKEACMAVYDKPLNF